MSAPAAKARSLPVTIMQRTCVPWSQASRASASSFSSGVFSAFSASGRLRVAMPTEPFTSVLMFMYASCLTLRTIKGRTARLHNALDRAPASQLTGLGFAAIDQEMMLEIAGIAGGLGVIAQGGAAGSNGILQHFLNRRHQRGQTLALDRARQPFGRDAGAEQRLADIDIAQACDQPLVQQRRLDR